MCRRSLRGGPDPGQDQRKSEAQKGQMLLASINTRGWNEGKWRTVLKEGEEYDVVGVGETGWHNSIKWEEGGWTCIGKGRKVGEKKVVAWE